MKALVTLSGRSWTQLAFIVLILMPSVFTEAFTHFLVARIYLALYLGIDFTDLREEQLAR